MSNDTENANDEGLTVLNDKSETEKKEDSLKEKFKGSAVKRVKLDTDGSLAEVMSEELLNDEQLEVVNDKVVLIEMKKDKDVKNLEKYISQGGEMDDVAIVIPAKESLSPDFVGLKIFASINEIPLIVDKGIPYE